MTNRRKVLLWTVVGALSLTLGSGLYAGLRWQKLKQELGIVTLDFSGVHLSRNHLAVRQIILVRQPSDDERLALTINNLRLGMESWFRPLPVQSLNIDHLEANWQPEAGTGDERAPHALPDRLEVERWATWVPETGNIASLRLTLPCPNGICSEQGQMSWQHAGEQVLPATLNLQVRHLEHRLALAVNAYEHNSDAHVDLQLLLDDRQRLSMQNQLAAEEDVTLWRGALAMSELPEAPWLLDWLSRWLDYDPPALLELPEQMRIGAGWALQVDPDDLTGGWERVTGKLRLSADLPAFWPVVGIGQLQGKLDVTAKADSGTWIPTALDTDLRLKPTAALLAELPAQFRPEALSLEITPATPSQAPTTLPLEIQLAASGPTPLTLAGQVTLETSAPYALSFENTRLRLQTAELLFSDTTLHGLDADLRLHGRASAEATSIQLQKGSQIALRRLGYGTEMVANTLQANLSGLGIEASFTNGQLDKLSVDGQAMTTIAQFEHPTLRPQGWRWSGKLNAGSEQFSIDGPLSNDAGLTLPLKLNHSWSRGTTRLDAALPELFLRAGNPLAATLADWPQALELNNGRLQGKVQLNTTSAGPLAATAMLTAKGVGGIYDRTELSGLDTELAFTLQREQLRLDITDLTLREANPGFTFGPLRFKGEFSAPVNDLTAGRLAWSLAELRLLGGRLWLDPGAADLAAETQELQAHLRGLQLPLLLEAYPAEGLTGTGVVDGSMLVQRAPAGISIEQGSLKAREPGGALQFRSAKIQALGQSNPAMRLVTEALDDFHYDLLSSDLHYAANGKLDLGLKLHGRNPALEGGRPINFSINLEEDIPALLTSLQLSDRVSETIQRRVQERLRAKP